ncbi:MAG: acyltransferase family protein, partial [Planctomycetota bacterium]
MSSSLRNPDRRHDLDALRASAMILGIIYHGALSLALGFPWVVQDPSASQPLYVFQSWVHGFRMHLFFIISGFFTAMLWKKRGSKALVTHRLSRILLPCIIGAITLV